MQYELADERFSDVALSDPFFDSIKLDYREFEEWFRRKHEERVSVMRNESGGIEAFLYLKEESGPLPDVSPALPAAHRLKIGTFKVNAHGTRLGERLLKRAFDRAVARGVSEIYVTIFPKHAAMLNLFRQYGFDEVAKKQTPNGEELVLARPISRHSGNVLHDFPNIPTQGNQKFLLGIYPEYHTRLFPESILNNESIANLEDVSHTNSIHKVYVCWMDLCGMRPGDAVVIYRTSDNRGPAHYRSVATSVCVVEEVRSRSSFANESEYIRFCQPYSVFEPAELKEWWKKQRLQVIKMLYSTAFLKRVNRKMLIDEAGLDAEARWGLLPLTDSEFRNILTLGQVYDRLIVH
jgi:L-amino acid N-acyltransferase YncA